MLNFNYLHIYKYIARESWVQSQVESYQKLKKWYLMSLCIYTQHHKVQIKGNVSQSWERSNASATPWCSSYRKWSHRVTVNNGRQLYLLYIYISLKEHMLSGLRKTSLDSADTVLSLVTVLKSGIEYRPLF